MLAILLFVVLCLVLLLGYPVALSLSGVSLLFAAVSSLFGAFDMAFLMALPNRLYGMMNNATLLAVPLFVFMGVMLERAKIAENLLQAMGHLMGRLKGGLALSMVLVGMLLAASTGIVGATVVTMGLMSLPTMLKNHYDPKLACGAICATGTLGQIIPPSIALVLLGDVLSNAYQQAQLNMGVFSPKTVSVGDLFLGAIVPGLCLVAMYAMYIMYTAWREPHRAPRLEVPAQQVSIVSVIKSLVPPLLLMFAVLGSILGGVATPTEAAAVGALGAMLMAWVNGQLSMGVLQSVMDETLKITSMVFFILIGAACFSLVFRGLGGDDLVHHWFSVMPGGKWTAFWLVMLAVFLLGFILDFIEITFVVVPIIGPALLTLGFDPVWLGIMLAVNLQTSFLTPPFGFALFYLRGVAPASIQTIDIYKGVLPFVLIQLVMLMILALMPSLVQVFAYI